MKPDVTGFYNSFAKKYENISLSLKYERSVRITSILRELMSTDLYKKRIKILELGAGTGVVTETIVPYVRGIYTATDISNNMLIQLRKKELGVVLCRCDAHFISFQTNVFDLVICCEVLEHLFSPLQALSEIVRCLKVNGYLLISTPNEESFYSNRMGKQPIERWLSSLELKSLFKRVSLYPVKSYTVYYIFPLLYNLVSARPMIFSALHRIGILQLLENFRFFRPLRNKGLYHIVVCRKLA